MENLELQSALRSLTRGRARIRHEKLRGIDDETRADVESLLLGFEGVTSARINPRVGSLLVTWDEAATSAESLLQSAGFFLAFLGDDEANADEAPASEKKPAEEKAAAACEAACAASQAAEAEEHEYGADAGQNELEIEQLQPESHEGETPEDVLHGAAPGLGLLLRRWREFARGLGE